MKLSAELFRSIVDTLKSDDHGPTRHEKRKEGRVGVRYSVDVTAIATDNSGHKTATVWVRDISPSGMGFVTAQPMKVGVRLVCRLPREDGSPVGIVMTVRQCRQLSKELYSIGASFETPTANSPTTAAGNTSQGAVAKAV
jgi:hypothetical protein